MKLYITGFAIFVFAFFFSGNLKAGEHTAGVSIGATFPLMDLGGGFNIAQPFALDLDWQAIRYSGSLYHRYFFNDWVAVKTNFMFAVLHGDDKYTKGSPPPNPSGNWYREVRNLNFTTYFTELSLMGEVNLKPYNPLKTARANYDRKNRSWAPYIGVGIGGFYFVPTTEYQGKVYNLRNVGTEGQVVLGNQYSLVGVNLLASLGVRVNMSDKVAVSLECLYHHTFTDYLDDVSTNYPDKNIYDQMTPIAQALSNRNLEPDAPYPNPDYNWTVRTAGGKGEQRGDVKDKDHFFVLQLSLSFNFGRNPMSRKWRRCNLSSSW